MEAARGQETRDNRDKRHKTEDMKQETEHTNISYNTVAWVLHGAALLYCWVASTAHCKRGLLHGASCGGFIHDLSSWRVACRDTLEGHCKEPTHTMGITLQITCASTGCRLQGLTFIWTQTRIATTCQVGRGAERHGIRKLS